MEITAARALVDALVSEGVDAIFGIPGTHDLSIWDAFQDQAGVRRILPRHEDSGALMVNGYARASGRPGVFVAAAGPGVTNTISALGTAYVDSVPMLLIATELGQKVAGRQLGHIHDVNDQLGMLRHVSGWATRVTSIAEASSAVHVAMARLRTERPRPIAIETPTDVLDMKGEAPTSRKISVSSRAADPGAVEEAARLLEGARSPVILAGGGAVEAAALVVDLAERLAAPVLTTSMGIGIIPDDHPLSVGTGFDLQDSLTGELENADVVLVIGTRFTTYVTRNGKLKIPGKIVQVDLDVEEIGKVYPAELGLLGHSQVILKQLQSALRVDRRKDAAFKLDLRPEKNARRAKLREAFPLEMGLAAQVTDALPRDAIIGCDMTGLAYWLRRVGIAYQPRSILYPVIYAGLGTGLPFAIGAQVAYPERKVVSISGDAGFQFSCHELATAVQLGMAFPVVVVNDNGYQALRPRQMKLYGRMPDTDLKNPDFVAFAKSYGADGERVGPDELGAAITRAFKSKRMTVIEVPAVMKHPEAVGAKMSAQAVPLRGK